MSRSRTFDVAIVGGGLAGSAAACHLAKAGRSVILFERDAAPRHKVCGEFISTEAQALLGDLGIDVVALGAVPIRVLRLSHGERSAQVKLPFAAAGLSRFVLDEALLNRARDFGADIRRGAPVRLVEQHGTGQWHVATSRGEDVQADAVFLATGKHDLRQFRRARGGSDEWIGFKMHFRSGHNDIRAIRETVDVMLFDGGYAGLLSVDATILTLCLLMRKSLFSRLNRDWQALLAYLLDSSPHLAARLARATPCWKEPLAISSLPFGYLHDDRQTVDGIYRLGDQVSVIPAFSGNGISIALHTAHLAAERLTQGDDAVAYHRDVRRDIGDPLRMAAWLSPMTTHAWTRNLAVQTCRTFPSVIRFAASKTRIQPAFAR